MNTKSKAEMERQYEDGLNKIRRHFSGAAPIQVHKPGLNSKDNIWAWWLDQITYAYDHSRGREGKILRAHPDLDLVLPELLRLALDVQPAKNPNFGKFFH